MRLCRFKHPIVILAILSQFTVFSPVAAAAGKYEVIYSFKGAPQAAYPGSLTLDGEGNLYGTGGGGAFNSGSVFELKRTPDGWTEKLLYSFTGSSGDTASATGCDFRQSWETRSMAFQTEVPTLTFMHMSLSSRQANTANGPSLSFTPLIAASKPTCSRRKTIS